MMNLPLFLLVICYCTQGNFDLCNFSVLLPYLMLCLFIFIVLSEVYTMQAVISPGDVVAGQVFGIQPSISVFDSNGILAVELSGYVYAEMGTSPVEYEPLWLGPCNVTSCGVEVKYDMAKVVLNNGIADFKVMILCTNS